MNTERTFPEDNDTLYREMTAYMPNCYFPTSLGEDAIHEFAGGEFVRIRDIICREYGFDEDRHIEEYAGVSARITRNSAPSPSGNHYWRKSVTR